MKRERVRKSESPSPCFSTQTFNVFIINVFIFLSPFSIDLLLAHSSAIYPAVLLSDDTRSNVKIRSVAFFNPAGHRRIMAMRPAWFTEGSVKVYQNKLGRMVFNAFGKSFIKATNTVTVKPENMNNVILSAQTMRYSNYKQVRNDRLSDYSCFRFG